MLPDSSSWRPDVGKIRVSASGYSLGVMSELIDILYAVGVIGAISIVVGVVTYAIAAITEWWLRK